MSTPSNSKPNPPLSQSTVTIALKNVTVAGRDIHNPVSQIGPNGRSRKPRSMTQLIIQITRPVSVIEWMWTIKGFSPIPKRCLRSMEMRIQLGRTWFTKRSVVVVFLIRRAFPEKSHLSETIRYTIESFVHRKFVWTGSSDAGHKVSIFNPPFFDY